MTAKILLVDLDKDYIRRTDVDHTRDLFGEALDNLKDDVQAWGAGSGIELKLNAVTEVEKEEVVSGVFTRTYTRVYAQLETDDDVAWFNLSLGKIKPATRMSHGKMRGWQFDWTPE
jgi:hypothetical protein